MTSDEKLVMPGLTVSIKHGAIIELFEQAPHTTFYHLRDAFGSIFGKHRKVWLERTQVKFANRGGMQVGRLGGKDSHRAWFSDKKFFYHVNPKGGRPVKGSNPDLSQITGEAYTRSEAALGLETGGTFRARSAGFLAIPIAHALNKRGIAKPGMSSPKALRKSTRAVNKETIVFQDGGRAPIVYLIDRIGGKIKGTGKRRLKRKVYLRPIFQLVRSVTKQPILKFMDTWEHLSDYRDKKLAAVLSNTVSDLLAGKKRG